MKPIRFIEVTPEMLPMFDDIEIVPMASKESRAKVKAYFAAKASKAVQDVKHKKVSFTAKSEAAQLVKREKVPNPAPIERRKPKRKTATKP